MAERRTVRRRDSYDEPDEPVEVEEVDEVDELDEVGEGENEDEYEDDERAPAPRSRQRRRSAGAGLGAAQAARAGVREIAELTGKEPEGVTGVERSEDGWLVGVEVVEDRRVPSAADILATYEIQVDPDGELVSYRRLRRYPRGKGDGSEGL
jgi:Gas vesicle synthesis protein GvpO